MKTFLTWLMVIFISISTITVANAQTIEDLLKDPKIDSTTRQSIVKYLNEKDSIAGVKLDDIKEFEKYADIFVNTLSRVCKTLNVEMNEFIKTDVGKLTAVLIVYKMIGKDLVKISVCLSIIITISFIQLMFYLFVIRKKKITKKDEKGVVLDIQYINRFDWDRSGEVRTVVTIISFIIWGACSIICFACMI